MKKKYHICMLMGGCLGAPSALTRLNESYSSEKQAKQAKLKLDSGNNDNRKCYFIEWEWA